MKKIIYLIIIAIGLLQIIGYVIDNKTIRGIGIAIASSPLPIVFTQVKNVETFASEFFIIYTDTKGIYQKKQITPMMYSKLKGPYNRRNIYGAAISYGPILNKKILNPVLDYAICKKVLLDELGFPKDGRNYKILIETKTFTRNNVWTLQPNCN